MWSNVITFGPKIGKLKSKIEDLKSGVEIIAHTVHYKCDFVGGRGLEALLQGSLLPTLLDPEDFSET
jgi:hypothetical protein